VVIFWPKFEMNTLTNVTPATPASSPGFIHLASQSPRRLQLLAQWGVTCQPLLPGPDEDVEALEAVRASESPMRYVKRVSSLKLMAALERQARRGLEPVPVLCADTTVALGPNILGKPESDAHAARMLAQLSGQRHRVLTAVTVGQWGPMVTGSEPKVLQAVSESVVTFAPLSPQQIARYVASGEPMGKAGAYGIQGAAALFISHISGSYSGIMGLPAFETAQLLRQFGVDVG
jgi:septum formation protein